jgi:adenosylcobalamin-dependent ribonucleoside-triphosphate reductase
MDYTEVAKRIVDNGEPGLAWLDNMRHYSRMKNGGDDKDHRVMGGNPCLEQSLESYELCCLVETFPDNHDDLEDYKRTLKFAYLYAKTVTLGRTHWSDTNRVMLRNRRIGCSVSGIAQFITNRGMDELRTWLEEGYDTIQEWDNSYSDWFAIPKSIKTTSVKPSGTVSLLAGATPGLHYPESRFYTRRIRISINSELIEPLKKAGYKIEPAFGSEDSTLVVEIPVDVGEGIRTASELTIWEQFSIAAFLQRHWADNQVSCTVTFDPEKEGEQIPHVLNYYQYHLKGISLLPRHDYGAYPQMPYEAIDEKEYNKQIKKLGKLTFGVIKNEEAEVDKFCNNESCEIPGLNVEENS